MWVLLSTMVLRNRPVDPWFGRMLHDINAHGFELIAAVGFVEEWCEKLRQIDADTKELVLLAGASLDMNQMDRFFPFAVTRFSACPFKEVAFSKRQ
jgi:hypothetical protein